MMISLDSNSHALLRLKSKETGIPMTVLLRYVVPIGLKNIAIGEVLSGKAINSPPQRQLVRGGDEGPGL